MEEEKICPEMAALEFDKFADGMDLDLDLSVMDEDDRAGFEKQKRRLVLAIQKGSLVINDDGEAVYTPVKVPDHKPITFHERTGASLMATDGKKKGYDASKMYAMMGDLARVHPSTFAKLKGIDIKVCEAIFALLMD